MHGTALSIGSGICSRKTTPSSVVKSLFALRTYISNLSTTRPSARTSASLLSTTRTRLSLRTIRQQGTLDYRAMFSGPAANALAALLRTSLPPTSIPTPRSSAQRQSRPSPRQSLLAPKSNANPKSLPVRSSAKRKSLMSLQFSGDSRLVTVPVSAASVQATRHSRLHSPAPACARHTGARLSRKRTLMSRL